MAFFSTKPNVMAFIEEDTAGTLKAATAASFTAIRDGAQLQGVVETVESDEMVSSLASGASFVTKETPNGSVPKYLKHSGTEATAPDYAVLLKSALGTQTAAPAEINTVASSTAGTASARAIIKVDTGEGASHGVVGRALLIKDGTNGYSIRNIYGVTDNDLSLNYNLAAAPASGVNLGRAILFSPATSGHCTFSAWHQQNKTKTANAFVQAIAGCRTVNTVFTIAANGLAEVSFDIEGTKFFMNPIEITASNKYIDFTDDSGAVSAILTEGWYQTPFELAREAQTKMNAVAAGGDAITVTFSPLTGQFTFASAGTTFELDWNTGTNTANTAGAAFGFTVSADDTGATTYTSDDALEYGTTLTPVFDDIDPFTCKAQELLLGNFDRTDCRSTSNFTLTISTPKQDIDSICAASGVEESVTLERQTTASWTMYVKKHELRHLDDMLQNTTSQLAFNGGVKSNGNWVAGKCWNVWLPLINITATPLGNENNVHTFACEARAKANTTFEDVYVNCV